MSAKRRAKLDAIAHAIGEVPALKGAPIGPAGGHFHVRFSLVRLSRGGTPPATTVLDYDLPARVVRRKGKPGLEIVWPN